MGDYRHEVSHKLAKMRDDAVTCIGQRHSGILDFEFCSSFQELWTQILGVSIMERCQNLSSLALAVVSQTCHDYQEHCAGGSCLPLQLELKIHPNF